MPIPTLPIYETTLNILKEAGFVLRVNKEQPTLVATNRVQTAFGNLISATNDTAVPALTDVKLYKNGSAVTVISIPSATDGILQTSATLAASDTIEVDYHYSPVDPAYVAHIRDDVEYMIYQRVRTIDPCAPYTTEVPAAVTMITRLWTAGLLLAREYGYNTDNEQSSKDGYKKIEEAKQLLEDFIAHGGNCGEDATSGTVEAVSDKNLFPEPRFRTGCPCSDSCYERDLPTGA